MSNTKVERSLRLGHAIPHHGHQKRSACSSGGFYKSPAASQAVPAGSQFNITWDPSCMTSNAIDIYLYAPAASNPRIHLWENVNFKLGTYETTLKPQWWNNTQSVNLQLSIVPTGTPPFLATMPAGPVFQGTYSNSSGSSSSSDANVGGAIEQVNNFNNTKSLSKGKVAAAVLMPILVVVALIAAAYIKISRSRGQDKRKLWTEAVDKRMSTISTDWKSISAAGAQAAIRHSMAVGEAAGIRASSFSFGVIRPDSTVAVEGGQAGIGAKGLYASSGIDTTTPQMTQLRPGLRTNVVGGERVSRVSFAPNVRPSVDHEHRRTLYSQYGDRASRAFHTGYVPPPVPIPERQDSGELSPTQTHGPLSLTAEDIHARMSGIETAPRPSVDGIFPALSMMRTGETVGQDDLLLSPKPQPPIPSPLSLPAVPAPTLQIPKSPIMGAMPMQPMPANMMSPDDMLRAYAERRAVASPPPSATSPIGNYNGNGMRVLYSPVAPETPVTAGVPESRKSMATLASKYDEDDAYIGTAE